MFDSSHLSGMPCLVYCRSFVFATFLWPSKAPHKDHFVHHSSVLCHVLLLLVPHVFEYLGGRSGYTEFAMFCHLGSVLTMF